MNHQDVVAKLIEFATPLTERRDLVINETTGITSELGMASLAIMSLVEAVEDEFDISVPINALAEVRTLGDLALVIQKLMGENA